MSDKPAYIIVDVDIHNPEEYERYKKKVVPIVTSFGGKYLARGGEMDIINDGLWRPTRMVLLTFPSASIAREFMESDAYAPVRKMREDNSTGTSIERGLFDETPDAFFLDGRNLQNGRFSGILQTFDYDTESKSSFIRLNDVVSYNADSKKSFIELYVDDRFPTQFYYGTSVIDGNNTQTVPALGNRILVSEHVPGATWAANEPQDKNQSSYTDLNGQYAFGNLDPGMYNITVFLEDISHQESTFRPNLIQPAYRKCCMFLVSRNCSWSLTVLGKVRVHWYGPWNREILHAQASSLMPKMNLLRNFITRNCKVLVADLIHPQIRPN